MASVKSLNIPKNYLFLGVHHMTSISTLKHFIYLRTLAIGKIIFLVIFFCLFFLKLIQNPSVKDKIFHLAKCLSVEQCVACNCRVNSFLVGEQLAWIGNDWICFAVSTPYHIWAWIYNNNRLVLPLEAQLFNWVKQSKCRMNN